jgi:hypothetical protein
MAFRVRILGDIHGKSEFYTNFYNRSVAEQTHFFQVGDAGVGFGLENHAALAESTDGKVRGFIRGNHDNPERCPDLATYIPCGTKQIIDGRKVMFVGGAWSIDFYRRTPHIDWWQDEENSYTALMGLLQDYRLFQPDIMVTHAVPLNVIPPMFQIFDCKSRTETVFQHMLDLHRPEFWFFGHYHRSVSMKYHNTYFRCFDINESSLLII